MNETPDTIKPPATIIAASTKSLRLARLDSFGVMSAPVVMDRANDAARPKFRDKANVSHHRSIDCEKNFGTKSRLSAQINPWC
jgi:hypothetical protein